MKRTIILLFSLLLALPAAFASERESAVVGLKAETVMFDYYRLNLVDQKGNADFGFFEIEKEPFTNRVVTYDRCEEPYNGVVDQALLQHLGRSYVMVRAYSSSLLIHGVMSGVFTSSGVALTTLFGLNLITFDNQYLASLVIGLSSAVLIAGITELVFMFVYLGLTAYHFSRYKKVRDRVINLLNGVPIGRDSRVRFRFALAMTF